MWSTNRLMPKNVVLLRVVRTVVASCLCLGSRHSSYLLSCLSREHPVLLLGKLVGARPRGTLK